MVMYKSLVKEIYYQQEYAGSTKNPADLIRRRKYQKKKSESRRLIGLIVGFFAGLLVSFGTVMYVMDKSEQYNEISIIKADKDPFKIPPTDPGGLTVDNKDSPIYCEISDCDEINEGQSILPLPEEPIFSKFKSMNGSEEINTKDSNLMDNNQLSNSNNEEKFQIQLGALRSNKQAKDEWSRLYGIYPNILKNYSPEIIKVNLDQKGIFYRLRAGPFKNREVSEDVCNSLLKLGVGCLVVPK